MTWRHDTQRGERLWLRGITAGPFTYVSCRIPSHPRRYSDRHLWLGRICLGVGTKGGLEAAHAEVAEGRPTRHRWIRKTWPAVLLTLEGTA